MSQGRLGYSLVRQALFPGVERLNIVNEDQEILGLALVVDLGLRSAALHFECDVWFVGGFCGLEIGSFFEIDEQELMILCLDKLGLCVMIVKKRDEVVCTSVNLL